MSDEFLSGIKVSDEVIVKIETKDDMLLNIIDENDSDNDSSEDTMESLINSAKLHPDIEKDIKSLLDIVMEGKEVSDDTVKQLAKNDYFIQEYEKWKYCDPDTDTKRLCKILNDISCQTIRPDIKRLLENIMDGEQVLEDTVINLAKDAEVVREYKKWKCCDSDSDSERLYKILRRHLGDDRKESGDYHKAIRLYTDSLAEIKQDTDRDNILYSRALCYYHTEQFNLCVEVFSNY